MSYFEERNIELYLKNEQTVAQYYHKLEKAFIRSKNEIQRTIESFYGRYAKENGLSYYESQMAINSAEIMELREFIEHSLNNIDNKYSKSLELASLRYRISRYEALQMQIDAMLTSLYSKDYEEASIDKLKYIYTNTYEMGRFNIDKLRGYGKAFSTIDENSLVKLIQYPFNGASFSSRIWKQKEHLQGAIMESLTTMLVQGSHPSKLSKELSDKFKTKRFDAYRLLHTESSYLTNRATIDSYIDDGVKKYQILATLDSKTCSICGSKDNKIIELKESLAEDEKNIVGLDLPPFHPLCRCTTVPYDDEFIEDSETRVARDENGEYIDVPASMGYGEWREKFVVDKTKDKEKENLEKNNHIVFSNTSKKESNKKPKNKKANKENNTSNNNTNNKSSKKTTKKKKYKNSIEPKQDTKEVTNSILNDDEISAINSYIGFKSYILNDKLRNSIELSEEEKNIIDNLDNALDKLPRYKGNLQRSLYFETEDDVTKFINSYKVGETKEYKEFISTTKGGTYNRDGQVQIFIKDTKNGVDISSINEKEQEVLYKRNSIFYTDNIVEQDDKYYILLKEKE